MKDGILNPAFKYTNAQDTLKPGYLAEKFAVIRRAQACTKLVQPSPTEQECTKMVQTYRDRYKFIGSCWPDIDDATLDDPRHGQADRKRP